MWKKGFFKKTFFSHTKTFNSHKTTPNPKPQPPTPKPPFSNPPTPQTPFPTLFEKKGFFMGIRGFFMGIRGFFGGIRGFFEKPIIHTFFCFFPYKNTQKVIYNKKNSRKIFRQKIHWTQGWNFFSDFQTCVRLKISG